ncbi:indoleamine 2,3-dioxygenase 1-like [Magallana gigas]|uniref:indoleamine 2,3-dioxygenase 1-like n=1 Tax=Magallana gigas TaxID=29159 RepID=UPI003342CCFB
MAGNALPRALAVPWCAVSKRLGLQPVICHPELCLANVKIKDPNRFVPIEQWKVFSVPPVSIIYCDRCDPNLKTREQEEN